jgi:hypothetical protein
MRSLLQQELYHLDGASYGYSTTKEDSKIISVKTVHIDRIVKEPPW